MPVTTTEDVAQRRLDRIPGLKKHIITSDDTTALWAVNVMAKLNVGSTAFYTTGASSTGDPSPGVEERQRTFYK